jgi:hypothetical protein
MRLSSPFGVIVAVATPAILVAVVVPALLPTSGPPDSVHAIELTGPAGTGTGDKAAERPSRYRTAAEDRAPARPRPKQDTGEAGSPGTGGGDRRAGSQQLPSGDARAVVDHGAHDVVAPRAAPDRPAPPGGSRPRGNTAPRSTPQPAAPQPASVPPAPADDEPAEVEPAEVEPAEVEAAEPEPPEVEPAADDDAAVAPAPLGAVGGDGDDAAEPED